MAKSDRAKRVGDGTRKVTSLSLSSEEGRKIIRSERMFENDI